MLNPHCLLCLVSIFFGTRPLGQVLHMTIGGVGAGRGAKYGDRTPAIWTHSTKGILVASGVRGKVSYSKYFKPLPPISKWVKFEIKQEVEASQMIYSVTIGGKKVLSTLNSKPSKFENVQVLSSSSWYTPTNGYIKHLVIENKNGGKGRATPPERMNFWTHPQFRKIMLHFFKFVPKSHV